MRWALAKHLAAIDAALLRVASGETTRLMIFAPPRHGKSLLISQYLPAWWLGTRPDDRIILTGYGDTFAQQWGRRVRDTIREAYNQGVFRVTVRQDVSAAERWDIAGHAGGMIAAGVGGAIVGQGGHLIIVDDPVKSREQAESATYRDRLFDWWRSDLRTRFEPGASVVMMHQRWHVDDLAGRLLAGQDSEDIEPWTVLSFPAEAEEDDLLGRSPGDALWPERYDLQALHSLKAELGSYAYAAMYQQRPSPREGGMFKRHWFEIVDAAPAIGDRARGWDLAGTDGGGDWTVGVRGVKNGRFYIEDVAREQLGPAGVRQLVRSRAEQDGREVRISLPQDPGQAGKEQAQEYTRLLAGYSIRATPETGPKHIRAEAFAAQCEAGNVALVRGPWNAAYIEELCSFNPDAKSQVDDQVDATSRWFAALSVNKTPTIGTL